MRISNQRLANQGECKCGCGNIVNVNCDYIRGHSSRVKKYVVVPILCRCGCGDMAKKGNSFIHGHNRQGCFHAEDVKKRIRATNLETYSNPEVIDKFKGKNNPFFGEKHLPESRAIMQEKAQDRCKDSAFIKRISITTKKALDDPVRRKKISDNSLAMWRNKESQEKLRKSRAAKPNKSEINLNDILDEIYPGEWKFTGDFSFIINGKNPDFVNCNGKKLIIELFGEYWHKGETQEDRAKFFSPFGYRTLVIWWKELQDKELIINKIRGFVDNEDI